MANTLNELKQSPFHQQLGEKLCVAFLSQQLGVSFATAERKVRTGNSELGDMWYVLAEIARRLSQASSAARYDFLLGAVEGPIQ